jgi:ferrous iron transport protein A
MWPSGRLTASGWRAHTGNVLLQLIFSNKPQGALAAPARTLADLDEGEEAVIEAIEAPAEVARRLMELGFLPGSTVAAARSAPGGDPRVFRVDGSEIALRLETAAQVRLRLPEGA